MMMMFVCLLLITNFEPLFAFQAIAIGDVRREITFCRKGNIDIVGLVENMSGYVCEHCSVSDQIYYSFVLLKVC